MSDLESANLRFPELIAFRAPAGFRDAIRRGAIERATTDSEFARSALFRALAAAGVNPAERQNGEGGS